MPSAPDKAAFELFRRLEPTPAGLPQEPPQRLEKWLPAPPWRPRLSERELAALIPEEEDKRLWEELMAGAAMAESEVAAANAGDEGGAEVEPGGAAKAKQWSSPERGKGAVFSLPEDRGPDGVSAGDRVRLAVNAAIHLRRPLLVAGDPGTGKTSLAYAIAWQLRLGPVLTWPITPRSRLREDGLYGYDAIGRLYATQIEAAKARETNPEEKPRPLSMGEFIKLGPVGTAFLPSRWPRVLLIDEIDKADLQLPNELLHLFEEGQFTIEELRREADPSAARPSAGSPGKDIARERVRTFDDRQVWIHGGRVRCHEFPIVVMTSNRERDFPPAFLRRCLRIDMPKPTSGSLAALVKAHFRGPDGTWSADQDKRLDNWIQAFLTGDNNPDRAIDQLLNAVYLLTHTSADQLNDGVAEQLLGIVQRPLSEPD